MLKTLKQIKITFTSISLLVLLCVSLILFAAQMALAQSTDAARTAATTELRTDAASSSAKSAISLEARIDAAKERRALFRERQNARAALLDEKRIEIEERRTARVAALEAEAQTRIMTRADNATARISAIIAKLSSLADRIEARADALEAQGADVSVVRTTLESVDALLAEASSALLSIDVEVEYVVTASEPRAAWQDARAVFVGVRDLLTEAHGLLRQAVAELKTAARDTDDGASAAVRQDE